MTGGCTVDTSVDMQTDDATFGERLEALRKSRRWSQAKLAAQAGVDSQTIYRLERKANVPDMQDRTLEGLSFAFGMSSDEFLAHVSGEPVDTAHALTRLLEAQQPRTLRLLATVLHTMADEAERISEQAEAATSRVAQAVRKVRRPANGGQGSAGHG